MKKPTEPSREQNIQAVVDYLVDNGLSDFGANQLLHVNMPALGGYRSILDEVRDENWDTVWNVAELYVSGDMW